MGKVSKTVKAVLFAFVLVCLGMGLCPVQAQAAANSYNDVQKSVVSVQFYLKDAAFYITDGENYQKVQDAGEGAWSGGSGFFVGELGEDPMYIVTNYHVVSDYVAANEGGTFTYYTGQTYQGYPMVIRAASCELRVYYEEGDYDVAYVDCHGDISKVDLAVLTLKKTTDKRQPLQLMIPTEDMVGETVYTVGFPGNAQNDFTSASDYVLVTHKGSISAFVASAGTGVERIQIDATIQHGNSGGPLVTEEGYAIGVNTNVESNSPYENQIEVDYYAINSSELVSFLDKNNVPYVMAKQGNSGGINLTLVLIIAICVVVCAAAVVVVVVVLSKKKKAARTPGAAPIAGNAVPPQPQPQTQPQMVQRALIRSLAAQHNGLTLVVRAEPILIGRDFANCKLVYAEGTAGVSGRHCSISFDAATGEFILTDLRSSFGTFFVGGQKLNANVPYRIKPGESFYLGDQANMIRVELG